MANGDCIWYDRSEFKIVTMPKLLLLSNSTNYGEGYLEYPKESIRSFLGDSVQKVLFIPYAGVGFSYDEYSSKVAAPFREVGYQVDGIHTFDDPKQAVRDAECIAVGGGNTFALLNLLYQNDLIEMIRQRVNGGMPFMGWSAGSIVAGPSIRTTNDMPIIEPPSFTALNLVPFQINPHYTERILSNHSGETRKDRLNEFIAMNPNMKVIGIPEGNLLEVINNQVRLVGPDEIKIFEQGKEIATYSASDDLSFLLNSQ